MVACDFLKIFTVETPTIPATLCEYKLIFEPSLAETTQSYSATNPQHATRSEYPPLNGRGETMRKPEIVKRRLLVVATALILAALVAPAVSAGPPGGPEVAGGGTYISELGNNLSFSVSARGQFIDAKGRVRAYVRGTEDVGFHGKVDCLLVRETRATLSGVVLKSDDPAMVGEQFFIQAWDFPDGDVISEAVVPSRINCAGVIQPMTTFPLRSGNIRIPFSNIPPTTVG